MNIFEHKRKLDKTLAKAIEGPIQEFKEQTGVYPTGLDVRIGVIVEKDGRKTAESGRFINSDDEYLQNGQLEVIVESLVEI